jgi:hypothetical protein
MHFLRTALITTSLLASFAFAACGGDDKPDADPFDTFGACYNDHHNTEGFDAQKAITICCIDHPIGNQAANVVCGSDAASCVAYVSAQVGSAGSGGSGTTDATTANIQAACTDYVNQRSM